jgi:hypothetical protein
VSAVLQLPVMYSSGRGTAVYCISMSATILIQRIQIQKVAQFIRAIEFANIKYLRRPGGNKRREKKEPELAAHIFRKTLNGDLESKATPGKKASWYLGERCHNTESRRLMASVLSYRRLNGITTYQIRRL